MPQEIPDCVPPSDEKVDMKRLTDDIPKSFNSSCFEEKHKKSWDEFLKDKEGIYTRAEPTTSWPLDDIILLKERQRDNISCISSEREETANVLQVPRPSYAQPDMESIVVKQLDEIPAVR